MIDREKLETVLRRRFPGASLDQVAAAANAIIGLDSQPLDDEPCAGAGCRGKERAVPVAPRLPSAPA